MNNLQSTTTFEFSKELDNPTKGIVKLVCDAMKEKGISLWDTSFRVTQLI